jgi:hypothetical protein
MRIKTSGRSSRLGWAEASSAQDSARTAYPLHRTPRANPNLATLHELRSPPTGRRDSRSTTRGAELGLRDRGEPPRRVGEVRAISSTSSHVSEAMSIEQFGDSTARSGWRPRRTPGPAAAMCRPLPRTGCPLSRTPPRPIRPSDALGMLRAIRHGICSTLMRGAWGCATRGKSSGETENSVVERRDAPGA